MRIASVQGMPIGAVALRSLGNPWSVEACDMHVEETDTSRCVSVR